jgi:hypothetical protein
VSILDERNILGTGKGDADVAAKGGQGLRQAGRKQGGAGSLGQCKGRCNVGAKGTCTTGCMVTRPRQRRQQPQEGGGGGTGICHR